MMDLNETFIQSRMIREVVMNEMRSSSGVRILPSGTIKIQKMLGEMILDIITINFSPKQIANEVADRIDKLIP